MNTSVCVSVGNKCYFFGKVCVRTKYKIPSKEPQHEFVAKYDKSLFQVSLLLQHGAKNHGKGWHLLNIFIRPYQNFLRYQKIQVFFEKSAGI